MAMDGQILMVGEYRHREFQNAVAQMEQVADVVCFRGADAALNWLRSAGGSPRWIVAAQSRPGQFYAPELEALFALSPLSRMVVLLGSWCEGETRSGTPYPGIERVYFHSWRPWFDRQWQGTYQSALLLSRTATPNDYGLADSRSSLPILSANIGISSRNADTVDALKDAFRGTGASLTWLSDYPIVLEPSDLDLAIAHDVEPRYGRMQAISHIESLYPNLPIVALVDFPRWDELESLRERVEGFISQPYRIGDLIGTVSQILSDLGKLRVEQPADDAAKSRQAA